MKVLSLEMLQPFNNCYNLSLRLVFSRGKNIKRVEICWCITI